MTATSPLDILKDAVLLERRGKEFYSAVAGQTKSEAVRKVFTMMAEEEDEHIRFLSGQYKAFMENHAFTPPAEYHLKTAGVLATDVLSEAIRKEISAASFEAAAISAAIDFENRSIQVYSERALQASDFKEKETYRMLADWEKTHHKLLHFLNEELRQQVWNDNSFWPF
jgi:rubrerythrin